MQVVTDERIIDMIASYHGTIKQMAIELQSMRKAAVIDPLTTLNGKELIPKG